MAPPPPLRGVDEPEMTWGLDMGEAHGLGLKHLGDRECRKGLEIGETGHDIFRSA